MPKQNSKARKTDPNEFAHALVQQSLEKLDESPKPHVPRAVSRIMAAMGRKGGEIGEKDRLVKKTKEERSRIASLGAQARWA